MNPYSKESRMIHRFLTASAAVLCAAGIASAQDKGGKVPWRHDPQAAIQEAGQKGLPMMLYFTSEG